MALFLWLKEKFWKGLVATSDALNTCEHQAGKDLYVDERGRLFHACKKCGAEVD